MPIREQQEAIRGLRELQRKRIELPAKAERQVLRGAWRRAANTIRDSARAKVPKKSGQLKASIQTLPSKGIRFKVAATARATLTGGQRAGSQLSQTAVGRPFHFRRVAGKVREVLGHPYAANVEFGHGFPGTRKRIFSKEGREKFAKEMEFGRSDVPPHPFMRPAWNENKDKVLDRFAEEAGKGIERLAAEKS